MRTIPVMKSRHHDRDEIRRLLEVRTAENLTFKELAARTGIPVHVFHHRAQQDNRAARAAPSSGFVEVVTSSMATAPPSPSGIELLLPGGVRVQLRLDFDKATLTRLLAAVPC